MSKQVRTLSLAFLCASRILVLLPRGVLLILSALLRKISLNLEGAAAEAAGLASTVNLDLPVTGGSSASLSSADLNIDDDDDDNVFCSIFSLNLLVLAPLNTPLFLEKKLLDWLNPALPEARSISVNRERGALDSLMVLAVEGAETAGTLNAVFVAGGDTGIPRGDAGIPVPIYGGDTGIPPRGGDTGIPPLGTDAGIPLLLGDTGIPSFVATSLLVLLFFSRLNRSFIDE